MEIVMRHEARQVPSWLIFDVRQKMRPLRIIIVTIAAPIVAALPYFGFLALAFPLSEKVEASAAKGMAGAAVLLLFGTLFGVLFLGLARLRWKTREMIVREHLHAWGPSLAALVGFPLALIFAFVDLWAAASILGATAIIALVGLGATWVWERYAYP
jgi:hypothetical protein